MEIVKIVQDGIELDVNGGEINASSIIQDADNRFVTDAQVAKINELNYTRVMTQAQYDALSPTEKNRTDVWYGIYEG